jgi:DNA-binding GntR family transcriptional regulator
VERHREVLIALQSRNHATCAQAIRTHMAQKLADIKH